MGNEKYLLYLSFLFLPLKVFLLGSSLSLPRKFRWKSAMDANFRWNYGHLNAIKILTSCNRSDRIAGYQGYHADNNTAPFVKEHLGKWPKHRQPRVLYSTGETRYVSIQDPSYEMQNYDGCGLERKLPESFLPVFNVQRSTALLALTVRPDYFIWTKALRLR